MNIKQIVISLIDRLAAYAAREAENEDPEETKRQEEAAAKRLAEKVKMQKAKIRENGGYAASTISVASLSIESNDWASPPSPQSETTVITSESEKFPTTNLLNPTSVAVNGISEEKYKGKEKEGSPVRKFRGVPQNVQLFEVFWKQVVELIKVCYTSLLAFYPASHIYSRLVLIFQYKTSLLSLSPSPTCH